MENNNGKQILNIPTAIIIAGAIISISILFTKTSQVKSVKAPEKAGTFEQQFKAVTTEDHIFGNPNAKIKIVEYSDTSCPYCKLFHNTMKLVMDEYGKSGNVAWVYRHYPLDKPDASGRVLHPNAGKEAQATECAASLGGNDKFWKYTNRLYEITPSVTGNSPKGLDQKELPKIADFAGLNVNDFNNCLSINKFKDKVDASFMEGVNIGIEGTPSSILVSENALSSDTKDKLLKIYEPFIDQQTGASPISISTDSKMIMMSGAMPIEVMKATIELLYK